MWDEGDKERFAALVAFVIIVLSVFALVAIVLGLAGCPSNPTPPTSSACFDDEDTRESCYTCASTPVCGWCPASDGQRRGCYPRTQPVDCEGLELVTISDACNALEDDRDMPAE